jgi:hypothetical protein
MPLRPRSVLRLTASSEAFELRTATLQVSHNKRLVYDGDNRLHA